MANNPWFRLYSEAVDDEKLRLLAFEDRWHFIALLCCKNNGILDSEGSLMRRKVAVKLGLDLRELGEVARRLAEVGLIDQESLQPIKWNDRQFKSDLSTKRVKEYRERQQSSRIKDETNVKRFSNVSETAQETETETDSKTESEAEYTEAENLCVSTPEPSKAGLYCRAMIKNGIQGCSPSHPTLLALIDAGATESEFEQAAQTAVSNGKANFAYALGIVKRQREEAAKLVLHKGRMPNKQESIHAQNLAVAATWMPPELREKNNES